MPNREPKRCTYCGSTISMERDHVIPLSILTSRRRGKGGGNYSVGRVVDCCKQCNVNLGERISIRAIYMASVYAKYCYEEQLAGNLEEADFFAEKLKQCLITYTDARYEEEKEAEEERLAKREEERLAEMAVEVGEEEEGNVQEVEEEEYDPTDEYGYRSKRLLKQREIVEADIPDIFPYDIIKRLELGGSLPTVKNNPFENATFDLNEFLNFALIAAPARSKQKRNFCERHAEIEAHYGHFGVSYFPDCKSDLLMMICLLPDDKITRREKIEILEIIKNLPA